MFGNFVDLSGAAACCHAVINPENCVVEMERVIAEARRENRPAYIAVPSDYALAPVVPADIKPIELRSNEAALQKAMAVIAERVNKAKSVVAFPAFTISRLGLQKQAQKAIEAIGCPFATTLMEKCVVGEGHPQFAGMYSGAASDPKTRQIVEGADLVLDLGGVNLNDITTAAYSAKLDPARFITVGLNDVRIGDDVITGVRLADVLAELAKLKRSSSPYRGAPQAPAPLNGKPSDRITMDALYPRYAAFLRAGDTVVLETGSTSLGVTPMALPDDVRVEAQVLWGSIGWATPAAFGIALADPDRRTVLITGEGSHQLTANDIGAMGRFGANVIVFVLNNSGYLIERALEENPNWTYNDLASWNYAELPKALGCTDWYTARVTTLGELDKAMKAARASKTRASSKSSAARWICHRPLPTHMVASRLCTAIGHNTHGPKLQMAERSSAFAICRQDTNVSLGSKAPFLSCCRCAVRIHVGHRARSHVPISGSRFPLPESEFRVLAAARLISAMA